MRYEVGETGCGKFVIINSCGIASAPMEKWQAHSTAERLNSVAQPYYSMTTRLTFLQWRQDAEFEDC